MDYVINSDDEDDVEAATDEEALVMAERLNNRRVLLAAFLKLTRFQVIDAKMAAPIWGYFINVRDERWGGPLSFPPHLLYSNFTILVT